MILLKKYPNTYYIIFSVIWVFLNINALIYFDKAKSIFAENSLFENLFIFNTLTSIIITIDYLVFFKILNNVGFILVAFSIAALIMLTFYKFIPIDMISLFHHLSGINGIVFMYFLLIRNNRKTDQLL